jgi:hypothetical protein
MKLIATIILTLLFFFAKAQDTTYNTYTYSITHDTLIRTTIPQQIVYRKDTTIIVSDTTYNSVYNTMNFTTVQGTLTVTVRLYDTIVAHDTVYVCVNCATHDTTVNYIVITPIVDSTIYGVFILNNPQTSLPSRITQAKNIHVKNTAYRYNYDIGQGYFNQRIKDSGLLCMMTFNNKPVQSVAYFPTGAELTACAATLDSLLNISKPDLLSFENEEGNAQYHKGTVQDYLAELNALTTVAHAHNVPTSNGGTTQGIPYAMRHWYQTRGRLDSVAWINNACSLSPNQNTSYSLQQVNWYEQLLAGIQVSAVDYVNYHWYEPPRTDTTPVITSTVLKPMVNYLRVMTGKPVISTEIGSRNHSSSLLFDMLTESHDADTKIIIYFDGVGSLAIQNEAAYITYLMSLP